MCKVDQIMDEILSIVINLMKILLLNQGVIIFLLQNMYFLNKPLYKYVMLVANVKKLY